MVSPTDFGFGNALVVPEDHFGDRFHGSILSEYTQLFGLAEHLCNLDAAPDRLYVFQYRKFVAMRPGIMRARNMPYAFAVAPDAAVDLMPGRDELLALGARVLAGPVIQLGRSLADSYANFHLIEDFVAFTASCATLAEFDEARIGRFINCRVLFPAPSLSYVSTQAFVAMMSTLRHAWAHFGRYYLQRREGYQRRVGGFLLERLHSFLLLEHLSSLAPGSGIVGHQIVVADSNAVHPTI